MADLSVSGKMKVRTFQAGFKQAYGLVLRVYDGVKFADENDTLAAIRKPGARGGEVKVNGRMLVGNFERMILGEFGIKVQVATPDNSKLADNALSLTAAGRNG